MAKEDEDTFLKFVRTTGDVVLLPGTSATEAFQPLPSSAETFADYPGRVFWLWNRSIVSTFESDFISERGYYAINGLLSSLVEVTRSYVSDNTMYPGRIWAEFTTADEERGDLSQKSHEFKKWYEELAKWIRREFMHTGWMMFAGPGALKFQDQGGRLPIGL